MDKKLKKGMLTVLIANLVNVFFSLATNFLLPKYLTIESYAGIKEFQLYVSYVGLFHLGFVDGIYLKYGGRTLGKKVDGEFSTDLSTMCVFQVFVTLTVLAVAIILRDKILIFFALSILPQNMSNYFKFLYQATGEFYLYGKAMNLTTVSIFVLNMVLLFVVQSDDVVWYIMGYVLLYFVIWIFLELYFRRSHILQKGVLFSVSSCVSNIRNGFLLTLGNLSSIFLTGMDRWFVKILMDTFAFAQYSFAVSVENFLNMAITPVTTTLYNYFCCIKHVNTQRKVFNCVVVFATVVPAMAFPVKFILETFLMKYVESSVVIFLLFSAQMFYTIIKSIYVNLYKVQRKQKIYFVKLVTILVIDFALNCVCYAVFNEKESFAVGTLLSAIVWYFLSGRDFKYLRTSKKTEIYLFAELIVFLVFGLKLPSVIGFICYVIVTVLLLSALMRETFFELLKQAITMLKKLKGETR